MLIAKQSISGSFLFLLCNLICFSNPQLSRLVNVNRTRQKAAKRLIHKITLDPGEKNKIAVSPKHL